MDVIYNLSNVNIYKTDIIAFVFRCSYSGCIYISNCYIFFDWSLDCYFCLLLQSVLRPIFSDISITTLTIFWFHLHVISFSIPITFNLSVSLDLSEYLIGSYIQVLFLYRFSYSMAFDIYLTWSLNFEWILTFLHFYSPHPKITFCFIIFYNLLLGCRTESIVIWLQNPRVS